MYLLLFRPGRCIFIPYFPVVCLISLISEAVIYFAFERIHFMFEQISILL